MIAKCKSCEHLSVCSEKYKVTAEHKSCPELKLRICNQCKFCVECSKHYGITFASYACEEFEKKPGASLADLLQLYFTEHILPALKQDRPVEDPDTIEKIEYTARSLASLIGKPNPEDLNRERLFLELIHEDFEIERDLNRAIELVGQIIQSEGVNIPLNANKIVSIVQSMTELLLIYKTALACGLAGYADAIMHKVIETKYGAKPAAVHSVKKT